jgi:hypothetical protein
MPDFGWNNTSSPHLGLIYEASRKNVSKSFESSAKCHEVEAKQRPALITREMFRRGE